MIGAPDQTGIDRLTDLNQGMAAMPANIGEPDVPPLGSRASSDGFGSVVKGPKLPRGKQIFGPTQADPAPGENVLGFPVEELLGSVGRGREGPALTKRSQEVLNSSLVNGRGHFQCWPGIFNHTSRDRIGKV